MKLTKKGIRIIAAFLSSFTFFWIAYNLLTDNLFGFVYIEIIFFYKPCWSNFYFSGRYCNIYIRWLCIG